MNIIIFIIASYLYLDSIKNFKSSDIRTLGIVAYGRDYIADLDVGLIEFY